MVEVDAVGASSIAGTKQTVLFRGLIPLIPLPLVQHHSTTMELDPLDGILYSVLLSSPNKLVVSDNSWNDIKLTICCPHQGFAALGTCFEGIVVGAILAQVSRPRIV